MVRLADCAAVVSPAEPRSQFGANSSVNWTISPTRHGFVIYPHLRNRGHTARTMAASYADLLKKTRAIWRLSRRYGRGIRVKTPTLIRVARFACFLAVATAPVAAQFGEIT